MANGDIGIMIWGDGNPLKLTLDKYDAWEREEKFLTYENFKNFKENIKKLKKKTKGGKFIYDPYLSTSKFYPKGAKYPTRLPLPRAEIQFNKKFNWKNAVLKIDKAYSEITGSIEGRKIKIEVFVHSYKNIIFIKINNLKSEDIRLALRWNHLKKSTRKLLKSWRYFTKTVNNKNNGYLIFGGPKGFNLVVYWSKKNINEGILLKIALASNHDSVTPLKKAKELLKNSGNFNTEFKNHFRYWKNYWKKSFISIPDFRIESLYYIELYKLGSLSRKGKLPISLQGLWTLDGGMPPWSGDYHLDLNVQMSYWPIYASNHLELGEPLYETFFKCIPRWKQQCKEFFGFDGIWSGCAIGPHGERVWGYTTVEFWPGNTAFLAHNYWLHYLYSQDKEFLKKRALPIMEQSFLIYANLLEKGKDGKLHIPYSYSPEYYEGFVNAYDKDSNIDIALIKFLTSSIIKAHKLLNIKNNLTERAIYVKNNLTDFVYEGKNNVKLKISRNIPFNMSHRHFSHLLAIHPLSVLKIEGNNFEKRLIKGSIEEIIKFGTGAWTGYSFPWFGAIAARAGYNNIPLQMLDIYIKGFISSNTLHINGDPEIHGLSIWHYDPMTLEGGFMAAATILEMLIQSYDGIIRVFPAIPDVWKSSSFSDLRAEGGFLVSSSILNKKIQFIKIFSETNNLCKVKINLENFNLFKCVKKGKCKNMKKYIIKDHILTFNAQKNTVYFILPKSKKNIDTQLTVFNNTRAHYFGKKKFPNF